MQEVWQKVGGVRVPTLVVMGWKATPKIENVFGCYGMVS